MSEPRYIWPYPDRTPVAMFEAPTAQPKQRHRKGGTGNMYTPEATRDAEDKIGWAFKKAAPRHRVDGTGRYSVAVYVVGAAAATDVDNVLKTVMDALQGTCYRNDNQVDEGITRRCVGAGRHVYVAVNRLEIASAPEAPAPLFGEESLVARTEARTPTGRWADPEWLARTAFEKGVYQMLETQPDVAHNGLMAYRPGRWAKAYGVTVDQFKSALRGLESAAWVTIDEDFGELLLHRHMVDDNVYRQPNILRSALRSIAEICSERIRAVLAEIVKGIREGFAEAMPEASRGVLDAMCDALAKGSVNPSGNPPGGVPGTLPEGFAEPLPEGSGVGVGVGETSKERSTEGSTFSRPDTIKIDLTKTPKSKRKTKPAEEQPRPDVDEICQAMVAHRVRLGDKPPTITQAWRAEARRMFDIDERDLEDALSLLEWSQNTPFWIPNIASIPKFREKFDQLRHQRGNARSPTGHTPYRNPTEPDAYHGGEIQ